MFTGIIEDIGKVRRILFSKGILKLDIETEKICEGLNIGDSIACNGVCLTLVRIMKKVLTFDVMESTYKNTNLENLKKGSLINLERALRGDSRLGGHFVTGHIDGVRKVIDFKKSSTKNSFRISLERGDHEYAAEKGSVCVEGVSLTIAEINEGTLRVDLIPHTLGMTTLGSKRAGDRVNVEFDILMKSAKTKEHPKAEPVTKKLLQKAGFI